MHSSHFRYFLWHGLLTLSLCHPIYNFIIHEIESETILEFVQLNESIYVDNKNRTSPVTVILLTSSPSRQFNKLKFLLPPEVKVVIDRLDGYKLRTPQVHVLIQPAHSSLLPGSIKFMRPIKKMNSSEIAKFVTLSVEFEKSIISPNIDKVLCFPSQQVILMNTKLGDYQSFTIYVVNCNKAENAGNLINELTGGFEVNNDHQHALTKMIAKELLNPIHCDSVLRNVTSIDV